MNAAARSPLEALADELGAVAGRIEREVTLRVAAAVADLRRQDAERELRFVNLERLVQERLSSLKDGDQGPQGERGASGPQGIPGERGIDGAAGADGLPGAQGEVGPMGPQGEIGLTGAQGPHGEAGVQGPQGDVGPEGPAGTQGAPGAAGAVGMQGERGPEGISGPIGPQGEAGLAGTDGIAGAPGEQGVAGKDGEPGPIGPAGQTGATGERGAEGALGKLPLVRGWTDGVHYEADVVSHGGSTYQALRDTGREPPHEDWQYVAVGGRDGADGRMPAIRGTWNEAETYSHLDIVALNSGSFVARRDNPGICPGDGWQVIAGPGKTGKPGERGAAGPKGEKGEPGRPVVDITVDDEGLLTLTNGDGSTATRDLYPLLTRIVGTRR